MRLRDIVSIHIINNCFFPHIEIKIHTLIVIKRFTRHDSRAAGKEILKGRDRWQLFHENKQLYGIPNLDGLKVCILTRTEKVTNDALTYKRRLHKLQPTFCACMTIVNTVDNLIPSDLTLQPRSRKSLFILSWKQNAAV